MASVRSAFEFEIEYGTVPSLSGARGRPACMSLAGEPIFNLYFNGDGCGPCDAVGDGGVGPGSVGAVLGNILGFGACAFLWGGGPTCGGPPPYTSPNEYNLDHPSYLLMEITDPKGSAYIQHDWAGCNIPTIFAKIVCYPNLRVDRSTPAFMELQGIKIVDSLCMRVLSPWHTLYHFHGRDWSGTLILVAPVLTGSLNCY